MKKDNFPNDGNHLTDGILSLVRSSDRTPSGKKNVWQLGNHRAAPNVLSPLSFSGVFQLEIYFI
jgi:hypothetical protein